MSSRSSQLPARPSLCPRLKRCYKITQLSTHDLALICMRMYPSSPRPPPPRTQTCRHHRTTEDQRGLTTTENLSFSRQHEEVSRAQGGTGSAWWIVAWLLSAHRERDPMHIVKERKSSSSLVSNKTNFYYKIQDNITRLRVNYNQHMDIILAIKYLNSETVTDTIKQFHFFPIFCLYNFMDTEPPSDPATATLHRSHAWAFFPCLAL